MAAPGNNSHVSIDITPSNGSVRMNRSRNNANEEDDDHHLSARQPRSRSNSRSSNNNNNTSPTRSRSTSNASNNRRVRRDTESAINDAIPLLETDAPPRQLPPLSGPEIDEDDEGDIDAPFTPNGGVDDGFYPENTNGTARPRVNPRRNDDEGNYPDNKTPNGDVSPRRRSLPRRDFPYAPEFGPGVPAMPGVMTTADGRIIPDVNVYQQKKNLAQGMMDLALISANANQLRYVLESFERHPYFYFSVVFISFSLILQVGVGIGLILNSRYNVKNEDDICKADKINNATIIGIFLITIVNVFISSFGVAEAPRLPS